MAFKIAIASGKGGTGKTTVSLNLLQHFHKEYPGKAALLDCDVEEPNDILFFHDSQILNRETVFQEIPSIDLSKCTFCRQCSEYCEFNAILVMPPVKFAEVNPALCHSCGACEVACKDDAIRIGQQRIGELTSYKTGSGTSIIEGKLKIGSALQTMMIRELKKSLPPDKEILFLDAPPGTSCPVVETISDSDYIILVSEPTPFGLHDLKLMVGLVEEMDLPFGVIVNKANLGDRKLHQYLDEKRIEILGEIPFHRDYASLYAKGQLFNDPPAEITSAFVQIGKRIETLIPVQ